MPPAVLVLVTADPEVSHRANEALRIALGLVAGEHPVTVLLKGQAGKCLADEVDELLDGDDILRHRESLARLGVTFHVDASFQPHGAWNSTALPTAPVSIEEIGEMVASAQRHLVF